MGTRDPLAERGVDSYWFWVAAVTVITGWLGVGVFIGWMVFS